MRKTKFCRVFKRRKSYVYVLLAMVWAIGIISCSENYSFVPSKIKGIAYNPSQPVQIDKILPDSGGYLTQFVIKGHNFGMDPDKINVMFNGNRHATIVSTNGDVIYGIVPKQENGDNEISVSVDSGSAVKAPMTFHYTKKEQVTTVTGGSGYADGTLANARFGYMYGVGVLKGNNLVIVEGRDSRVRLIAIDDDKVSTLYVGANFGHPAVSKDGTRFYLIQINKPHQVFCFDRKNAWAPKRLTSSIEGFDGDIFSCAMDDDEKYLYFREHNGKLGRLEIDNPENVDTLNDSCGQVSKNISYLAWNPVEKCFYLSVQNAQGIYKISHDGKTVQEYAGFNGVGSADGPRLMATMKNPTGMAFDADGNMYFTDSMGFTIRKIDRITGMLTTVAGKYGKGGDVDGEPLDALFNYPYDISIDKEGNFYIVEGWGDSVRKYAIE